VDGARSKGVVVSMPQMHPSPSQGITDGNVILVREEIRRRERSRADNGWLSRIHVWVLLINQAQTPRDDPNNVHRPIALKPKLVVLEEIWMVGMYVERPISGRRKAGWI